MGTESNNGNTRVRMLQSPFMLKASIAVSCLLACVTVGGGGYGNAAKRDDSSAPFRIDRNGRNLGSAGLYTIGFNRKADGKGVKEPPAPSENKSENHGSLGDSRVDALLAKGWPKAPDGSRVQSIGVFSCGRAMVQVGDSQHPHFGFIDENAAWVINPQFPDVQEFSEGLAAVMFPGESSAGLLSGDLWGYIDEDGKTVIKPSLRSASPFVDGLAPASGTDSELGLLRTGLIDKTGTFVLWSRDWTDIGPYAEGMIPVCCKVGWWFWERERWGYMDKAGKILIQPRYDAAASFSEGLASVKLGEKWGYIDVHGRLVIRCRYRFSTSFHNGVAVVSE